MSRGTSSSRIETVDALRGFTLLGIILLHHIEHFDFYEIPHDLPEWLYIIDQGIWKSAVFFFAGKAYGIFALLFGFTFYLQFSRNEKSEIIFNAMYLWRLLLLLCFGLFNSIFYKGDILMFYAILGMALLVVSKWSSKTVLIIAVILLLQPLNLINSFCLLINPEYIAPTSFSEGFFNKARHSNHLNSFSEQAKQNLTNGKAAVFFWSLESGRILKTLALFLVGMLLGREGRFIMNYNNYRFWARVLILSAISFIPLFILKISVGKFLSDQQLAGSLRTVFNSWSNSAFMMIVISSFVFLYSRYSAHFNHLGTIGRMSLTCYVMQSVLGSFVYYEYGLGLHNYAGASYSLLIGVFLFILQFIFCKWWLKTHKQGPLESLWRNASLIFESKEKEGQLKNAT